MPTIMVSYRRDDTRWITGRIVDRLERDYGKDQVFMDIDAIRPGMDFRDHLQNVLGRCDVLLAIIGPHWSGNDDAGRPRLDDPADWVRVEIETALAKRVPVIPVLIDRTRMPKVNELPESMREFAYRQGADLDTGKDFHRHMDHLVEAIRDSVARRPQPAAATTPSQPPPVARMIELDKAAPSSRPSVDAAPAFPRKSPAKSDGWIDLESVSSARATPQPARPSSKAPIIPGVARAAPARVADSRKMKVGLWLLLTAVAAGIALVIEPPQALYHRFFPAPPTPVQVPASSQAQVQVQAQSQSSVPVKNSERFAAAVAQRAVLYEEDSNDVNGRRYSGSVVWRSEKISPGAGKEPETSIKADIEIPERRLSLTWSLRRNTDRGLPASHTIEVIFKVPPGFEPGGVANVPGTLMKASEQTRGVPLVGMAVKVTNGYFLIGLSDKDADRKNNVELLKDRGWLDIPVVYDNEKRAIIAVEKGASGDAVFKQVFADWDKAK